GRIPVRQLLDVFFGDLLAVAVAQHGLENDTDRHRQARYIHAQAFLQRRQRVELAFLAARQIECLRRIRGVAGRTLSLLVVAPPLTCCAVQLRFAMLAVLEYGCASQPELLPLATVCRWL